MTENPELLARAAYEKGRRDLTGDIERAIGLSATVDVMPLKALLRGDHKGHGHSYRMPGETQLLYGVEVNGDGKWLNERLHSLNEYSRQRNRV